MRRLTSYAAEKQEVLNALRMLADHGTDSFKYRAAFHQLGQALGELVRPELQQRESVALAASSEDADWLMSGILDGLREFDPKVAVLWNFRSNPFGKEELAVAPIVKEYVEDIAACDTLIVCKSIIYTSCVVRANLIHLIEKALPKRIFVLSPVMFQGAADRLKAEFPPDIRNKFQFRYFAEDDELSMDGSVNPGIGGSVYERLGIGNSATKNRYIPQIVQKRRALQSI